MLKKRVINATDAPPASGNYAQAFEVANASRFLYVSGQIPVSVMGEIPTAFSEQARLVWHNVNAQLHAAGMTMEDVVKVTTFLSDRSFSEENRVIRSEMLGDHRPALTVIIADIFDSAWLLEIEVIAAA